MAVGEATEISLHIGFSQGGLISVVEVLAVAGEEVWGGEVEKLIDGGHSAVAAAAAKNIFYDDGAGAVGETVSDLDEMVLLGELEVGAGVAGEGVPAHGGAAAGATQPEREKVVGVRPWGEMQWAG